MYVCLCYCPRWDKQDLTLGPESVLLYCLSPSEGDMGRLMLWPWTQFNGSSDYYEPETIYSLPMNIVIPLCYIQLNLFFNDATKNFFKLLWPLNYKTNTVKSILTTSWHKHLPPYVFILNYFVLLENLYYAITIWNNKTPYNSTSVKII